MLESASTIKGLEVYAPDGKFVGVVDELILDINDMSVHGLYINDSNPALVDEKIAISIPMRWVQSIGDVVILRVFPSTRIEKPVTK